MDNDRTLALGAKRLPVGRPPQGRAVPQDGAARRLLASASCIAAITLLVLGLETVLALSFSPAPWHQLSEFSAADARNLVTGFNRNFNALLAVVFTTVAIAVPLTANMYSVKFLELFIRDRVNQLVLLLFVFGMPNNIWLLFSTKEHYLPVFQVYLSLALSLLYPALLVPYLYYVFQFLHPNTLLNRLRAEAKKEWQQAMRQPGDAAGHARAATTIIEHMASIGIRAVDRTDRSTAIATVLALRQTLTAYWQAKPGLPAEWFVSEELALREATPGAMADAGEARHTFEATVLAQLRAILSAAVPHTHDVVSAIADVTCELGLAPESQRDAEFPEMIVRYFNTFIRLAINRHDHRSVFTLFNQYRNYAAALCKSDPDRVLDIAYYFQYYAIAARDLGMPFIVETIAHDLGVLVQLAWQQNYANRVDLLERFLEFDRVTTTGPLPGVKKAQAILAGFFLQQGLTAPADKIAQTFADIAVDVRKDLCNDLLHVLHERYWEVNDRQTNMDYVPAAQRAFIGQFFDQLQARPG